VIMMNDPRGSRQAAEDRAGLCARCAHVQIVRTPRGSAFFLCRLSATDPRFPKYPALPVVTCAGYRPAASSDEL
jgi:hypothetical protein